MTLLAPLAGCDKQKARRPVWWPPEPPETGLEWPPPRPDHWPDDKAWPPVKEAGEDPEDPGFWTRLYGKHLDASEDEAFESDGSFGNYRFRNTFPEFKVADRDTRPGCGKLFTFIESARSAMDSCEPYPEDAVRDHCTAVFDKTTALRDCRRICTRNRTCRKAHLYPPPHEARWGCGPLLHTDPDAETPPEPTIVGWEASCWAAYLCECYEN
jgi:hypothetical protein